MNQTRLMIALLCGCWMGDVSLAWSQSFQQHHGQYIDLTTDLESAQEAKTLVESFDAAVDQWIEFWDLAPSAVDGWKIQAHVIRDKTAFVRAGRIPTRVPDFPFGYAMGNTVWVMAQPSEYYTRHLLLHEAAHALAFEQYGGAGPTWFREGTAELVATHAGKGDQIRTLQIPGDRDAVAHWGRFKKLNQLRDESRTP